MRPVFNLCTAVVMLALFLGAVNCQNTIDSPAIGGGASADPANNTASVIPAEGVGGGSSVAPSAATSNTAAPPAADNGQIGTDQGLAVGGGSSQTAQAATPAPTTAANGAAAVASVPMPFLVMLVLVAAFTML